MGIDTRGRRPVISCAREIVRELECRGAGLRARGGALHIAKARNVPQYLIDAAREAEPDIVAFLEERKQQRLAEQARRDSEAAAAKRDAEMELLPGGERIAGPIGIKDVFR